MASIPVRQDPTSPLVDEPANPNCDSNCDKPLNPREHLRRFGPACRGWLGSSTTAPTPGSSIERDRVTFRRAYDALVRVHGERADVEYLRILQLAATAGEARVVEVLAAVLDQVGGFDYVTVQTQVAPPVLTVPVIHIPAPDLTVYDALRAGAAA